jgi:hypothetical protein
MVNECYVGVVGWDRSHSPGSQALLIGTPEGKFLVNKFVWRFGMSFEGNCHEVEVTPYLELIITFGMSLEGVCHELYT